jgi:hypothetical protein
MYTDSTEEEEKVYEPQGIMANTIFFKTGPPQFDCSTCEGTGFVMSDEATWSPTECPYCS